MKRNKVQVITKSLDIVGLTDDDLNELGYWYSYFTNRRLKNHFIGNAYVVGSPIVDKKARRKGLMFLGNILSKLDSFESPLQVESFRSEGADICFKCLNKKGERLVVLFSSGDLIDFPTYISVVGQNNSKSVCIMLDRAFIFDQLSYYGEITGLNPASKKIYDSLYGTSEDTLKMVYNPKL